jgi:hypothetical protein
MASAERTIPLYEIGRQSHVSSQQVTRSED